MALLEIIKCDFEENDIFAKKYDNQKIPLGSQLIVNQTQEAIFVSGGKVCDVFGPGTHTLTTANLPILATLINLPFGGKTPFTAEIWFVNRATKTDLKWGARPFLVDDPVTGVAMLATAYGQWGMYIEDSRSFVTQLVGTMPEFDADNISDYFLGAIVQNFVATVADFVANSKIPLGEINAHINQISQLAEAQIGCYMDRFGIKLTNFQLQNFALRERELEKIQDTQLSAYQLDKLAQKKTSDSYKTARQFDVLDKAVEKPGAAGDIIAAGMALGGGLAAGMKAGRMWEDQSQENISKKDPESRLKMLKLLLDQNLITPEEFEKKKKSILEEI